MFRKCFRIVFAVLLVFALSSGALALQPQDALSARPAQSIYTVIGIEDMNSLLKYVLSPANVEMLTSLAGPDQADGINLVVAIATQIPAKSVLVAAGLTMEGPFAQVVATMPESLKDKLGKLSDGSAKGVDIISLLLGEGGMMLAPLIEDGIEAQKGPNGAYYTLMGMVALAAKDNLLMIASSPDQLDASLEALAKKDNRLALKRRSDSQNFWFTHIDMPTAVAMAGAFGGDMSEFGNPDELIKLFKAPLEMEFALSPKPDSVLLSVAVNALESIANMEGFADLKPVKGANLFMAGGGKLLFALSSPLAFSAADIKANPAIGEAWGNFVSQLEALGMTEKDFEDLLNGSFSVALGSDANVMGIDIPGGYIALTGREGAAAKILGKLMALGAAPVNAVKADGWDSLYAVDPEMAPVSLIFGIKKDTLFAGLAKSDAVNKAPALPDGVAKTLNDPLFGIGFLDAAGIWNWLKQEMANPGSLLAANMEDEVKGIMNFFLEAELSVPLIKLWCPELERSFMEFTTVDVPLEKGILHRLYELGKMFM